MPRQTCEAIESLPALTEPVSVVAIDVYRDGGSVEVTLEDAQAQRLILFLDCGVGIHPLGRMYLKANSTPCMHPVIFYSSAETEVFRLLRLHLDERYAPEDQARLAGIDGNNLRDLCQQDFNGWTLLRCLKLAEELRKLVTLGVVPDPVSFRLGG